MAEAEASLSRFKVLKESFGALFFDLGGLLAGGVAAYYVSLVLIRPWVVMIYPIVLTVKGAVNGILAGRISTGLHIGLVKPSFKGNTRYYHSILSSICMLSLISSASLGIIVFIISSLFYDTNIGEFGLIIFSCLTAKALAIAIVIPITSLLASTSYKKGLDPDIITYPVSSTIADVLATITYVFTLALMFWLGLIGNAIVYIIGFSFIFTTALLTYVFRMEEEFWKTIKEALVTIFIVILIASLSGFALSHVRSHIELRPGILMVYPALIDTIGGAGSIFGSISTTKIALGSIEMKIKAVKDEAAEVVQIGAAALPFYFIYGLVALLSGGGPLSFVVIILSLLTIFLPIMFISFLVAILTRMKGLDPDNFVIPFETALADCLLTLTLSTMLILFYGA